MDLLKRMKSVGMGLFGGIVPWRAWWGIAVVMAIQGALCSSAFEQERLTPEQVKKEFISVMREEADQGNPVAPHFLGLAYQRWKDYAEAVRWFRKAAGQKPSISYGFGDIADAEFHLGRIYDRGGHGVVQDYAEALGWYRKAADKGSDDAEYYLGQMYDRGQGVAQDYAEAARWYRKAADKGGIRAECNLGAMYYSGQGVTQDYDEASRWFRLAAEKEAAVCQANLAHMYVRVHNYDEGVVWYRKAAELGDAGAQFNLGKMYSLGQGVPQDFEQAYFWISLAVSRASSAEERNRFVSARGLFVGQMTAQQIAEAQRLAKEWRPQPVRNLKLRFELANDDL